jgi:hypothetical protein
MRCSPDMQRTITHSSDASQATGQNASRRRRLLSNAQLDAAVVMNTAPGRARYMAGFGDVTPPDRRPKAAVVRFPR